MTLRACSTIRFAEFSRRTIINLNIPYIFPASHSRLLRVTDSDGWQKPENWANRVTAGVSCSRTLFSTSPPPPPFHLHLHVSNASMGRLFWKITTATKQHLLGLNKSVVAHHIHALTIIALRHFPVTGFHQELTPSRGSP